MLILASQSPARADLLRQTGLSFETQPANIDERLIQEQTATSGATFAQQAIALAQAKALKVSTAFPKAFIIGADQTLDSENQELHKPIDLTAARNQLLHLRNKTHNLHAATALAYAGKVLWSDVSDAQLTMRNFSDAELDQVLGLESAEIAHCVGSYRLEGPSVRLFEEISGDYFTILGLPLLPLMAALRKHAPQILQA